MVLDNIFRNGEFITHKVDDDGYEDELLTITQKWYRNALLNTDYDPYLNRESLRSVISLVSSHSVIESKENEEG